MNETKTVHWSELFGNKYLTAIDSRMLTEEGYKLKTVSRTVGMSHSEPAIPLIIHFDRDYVIEVIKKKLLETLTPTSYNELQKIISEAWKEWKN